MRLITRSVLIQMAAGEEFEPLLRWAEPRHRAYAERHGLEYQAHYELPPELGDRHPFWAKIPLVLQALQRGAPYVFWLDADTLIVRPEVDLRRALPQAEELWLGMVANQGGVTGQDPWHLNAGAYYVRNTPTARRYFQDVWESPSVDPWYDQTAMNRCMEDRNWDGLYLLRPHWNCTEGVNSVPNPIVRAWHGCGSLAERLERMQAA